MKVAIHLADSSCLEQAETIFNSSSSPLLAAASRGFKFCMATSTISLLNILQARHCSAANCSLYGQLLIFVTINSSCSNLIWARSETKYRPVLLWIPKLLFTDHRLTTYLSPLTFSNQSNLAITDQTDHCNCWWPIHCFSHWPVSDHLLATIKTSGQPNISVTDERLTTYWSPLTFNDQSNLAITDQTDHCNCWWPVHCFSHWPETDHLLATINHKWPTICCSHWPETGHLMTTITTDHQSNVVVTD